MTKYENANKINFNFAFQNQIPVYYIIKMIIHVCKPVLVMLNSTFSSKQLFIKKLSTWSTKIRYVGNDIDISYNSKYSYIKIDVFQCTWTWWNHQKWKTNSFCEIDKRHPAWISKEVAWNVWKSSLTFMIIV